MLQHIEKKGTAAVKRLRRQKLAKGLPFMINANDLPPHQCFLEYPDGSILLVALAENGRDFDQIRVLTPQGTAQLRLRFNLTDEPNA